MDLECELLIVTVGCHVANDTSAKIVAKQVDVAQKIKDFMSDKFVGKVKFRVYHFSVINDDVGVEIS